MSRPLPTDLLVPPPRRLVPGQASLALDRGLAVQEMEGDGTPLDRAPETWLKEFLARERLVGQEGAPQVVLALGGSGPPGGYSLFVDPTTRQVQLLARDRGGLFAAVATLQQLVLASTEENEEGELPGLRIEDAPLFQKRGFMLDISRDRIPTMERLRGLIEHLARLKYNELQLYVEHTFAYPGHEEVWRAASPLTPAEVRELDRLAAGRGIELVPNQNCLGHWHRWLVHDRYRPLAEVPEGIEHPFHLERQPFSLSPTEPRVPELLDELFDAYLPCFTSGEFNVGLDEADDIGTGRSRAECEARGVGRVYLEHLHTVHRMVGERGRRMQFWGDIIVRHPELVPELPRDAIALEWGYEAGHPFEEHAALFADSGLDFHVCPGTSSWQSIIGRLGNLRANLHEAAREGGRRGARGFLVTDWGDYGHWQPEAVSWAGLVLGASQAWAGREPEGELEAIVSHTFLGDTKHPLGGIVLDLARVAENSGSRTFNGTPFFFLIKFVHEALSSGRFEALDLDGLEGAAVELEAIGGRARSLPSSDPRGSFHGRELAWAADLARLGAGIGMARLRTPEGAPITAVPRGIRGEFAAELEDLVTTYRALWSGRSRPGGVEDSVDKFLRSHTTLLSS